jgi:hypothetical protein
VPVSDGGSGVAGDGGDSATVTDGSEFGSLAPLASALDLLGGVVGAARPLLARFAAGRLSRSQIADLKWVVSAANRSLQTMYQQGLTHDSLREMVMQEAQTGASVWWHTECNPTLELVARGLGFNPDADDVRAVIAWAITGEGPQPKVPERPESRPVKTGYRCHDGPPGSPGHGSCARWPGCSTNVNGKFVGRHGSPDCNWPDCSPPDCTRDSDHQHSRDERMIPPGFESAGGWVRHNG